MLRRRSFSSAFIPTYLEGRTQLILRTLMARPLSKSEKAGEKAGYIYALELHGKP